LGPHEKFGNPFGNKNDYQKQKLPEDIGTPLDDEISNLLTTDAKQQTVGDAAGLIESNVKAIKAEGSLKVDDGTAAGGATAFHTAGLANSSDDAAAGVAVAKGKLASNIQLVNPTGFNGKWELFCENKGVSSMHTILLPKVNKVLMYDATIWRVSKILLPNGHCRVLNEKTGEKDCYTHSVLLDMNTTQLTPLEGGANTVLGNFPRLHLEEYPNAIAAPRW
ncbi:unnamed protein product, partial [Linum tenue]